MQSIGFHGKSSPTSPFWKIVANPEVTNLLPSLGSLVARRTTAYPSAPRQDDSAPGWVSRQDDGASRIETLR
jgi:hypothetical protein